MALRSLRRSTGRDGNGAYGANIEDADQTPVRFQPKFNWKKHRQRADRWICLVLFQQVSVPIGGRVR